MRRKHYMLIIYEEDCSVYKLENKEKAPATFQIDLAVLADMSIEWNAAESLPEEIFFIPTPGAWNGCMMSKIQEDEIAVVYENKLKDKLVAIVRD
jgi:hypothetical protein